MKKITLIMMGIVTTITILSYVQTPSTDSKQISMGIKYPVAVQYQHGNGGG
ncbi:hypothetical protein [Bacillus paramycoides]|uniref:hypothetical protein n=1 Tax=Bacillus paramycoides TaxID=2026194 RepID=UPI003D012632